MDFNRTYHMRLRFFISIFILLVSQSCNNNDIKDEIETFMSSPVDLALDSMQNVAKSVSTDSVVCDYTLVDYVDSTNCTECAITHFTDWKYLEEEIIEKGINMSFVFILEPPREYIEATKRLAKQKHGNKKNVYIDASRVLRKNNPHLPKSQTLHIFLLDKEGNVLLVGNPLRNESIEKLMYKIITEGPSSISKKK